MASKKKSGVKVTLKDSSVQSVQSVADASSAGAIIQGDTPADMVANALVAGYSALESSASHLETVCATARAAFNGDPISDATVSTIVDKMVAAKATWADSTKAARKSEAKRILSVYHVLPAAIAQAKAKGPCDWRGGIKLARLIADAKGDVKAAVAEFTKAPAPKAQPITHEKVAKWLTKWYAESKGDQKANIIKACETLGLQIEGVNA